MLPAPRSGGLGLIAMPLVIKKWHQGIAVVEYRSTMPKFTLKPVPSLGQEQLLALKAMAADIAKELVAELIRAGAIGSYPPPAPGKPPKDKPNPNEPDIKIDESLIALPSDTAGLEKGNPSISETSIEKDQALEKSKDKLRSMLAKKGDK